VGAVTWLNAVARSLIIVVYLILATVWLPDMIVQMQALSESPVIVRDLIPVLVWSVGLAGGLVGMRVAQSRGLI
jgi:hypothetical protein